MLVYQRVVCNKLEPTASDTAWESKIHIQRSSRRFTPGPHGPRQEQQALRHHPDKNPENVEEATAKFKLATGPQGEDGRT
jgi:hypothetical protein